MLKSINDEAIITGNFSEINSFIISLDMMVACDWSMAVMWSRNNTNYFPREIPKTLLLPTNGVILQLLFSYKIQVEINFYVDTVCIWLLLMCNKCIYEICGFISRSYYFSITFMTAIDQSLATIISKDITKQI